MNWTFVSNSAHLSSQQTLHCNIKYKYAGLLILQHYYVVFLSLNYFIITHANITKEKSKSLKQNDLVSNMQTQKFNRYHK